MADDVLIEGEVEERRDATVEALAEEQAQEREMPLIDGGRVVMMVGNEERQVPILLPMLFQQLWQVLGSLDQRLQAIEEKAKDNRIITLN